MNVYFLAVYTKEWQRVKIGRTKNVENRIKELQTGSPAKLNLLGHLPAKSEMHARSLESWLHRRLEAYRVDGEWFQLSAPVREFILAVCSGDEGAAKIALEWIEKQGRKRMRRKRINIATGQMA